MDPFLLLLIGLATVLGGILWLRLHPFLALFIAALLIAGITPKEQVIEALTSKYFNERIKKENIPAKEISNVDASYHVEAQAKATAYASNNGIRKPANLLIKLLFRLFTNYTLEVSYEHWIGMRTSNSSNNIIGIIDVSHPVSYTHLTLPTNREV